MKETIYAINKEFESRIRLGIMSVLAVNDRVDFNTLKDLLGVTDGNLSSHLKGLERAGYVQVIKRFVGRRPNTAYLVTRKGKKAFADHLDALEKYLRQQS